MDTYVFYGTYCKDALVKRSPFRDTHLRRLSTLKQEGKLITLGPTKSSEYVYGIFKAQSLDEVKTIIKEDIYWKEGVWTSFEVHSWIQAF